MIRLYNTLGREVQNFKPQKPGEVSLYTCGPTVYDYAHIGNLRSFVFEDTLRRVLQAAGYKVRHVMNITDVGHLDSDADEGEDKLEKGAKLVGKTVWQVADFYIRAFLQDMSLLNVLPPNAYAQNGLSYARATDFIDQQIELIKKLYEGGYVYQTSQALYFDVEKLPDYGKLSGQKLEEKEVGARDDVVTDTEKKHPQDFAVWFFRTGRFATHAMYWSSPWGDGFPGWHLECSAIIHATLGDPVDIHTGGVDHIGTHHTNEIAQTEAAYDNSLAKFWLHNEHLLVDGQKMSKSKKNFITLSDVTAKGYRPTALRLVFLQAHYRTQQNFTWEAIKAASTRLRSYQALADLRFQLNSDAHLLGDGYFEKKTTLIKEKIFNDLSTPATLPLLDETVDWVEQAGGIHPTHQSDFSEFLEFVDQLFGLGLLDSKDISHAQKQLILDRVSARKDSDWPASDRLRDKLRNEGLELTDYQQMTIWRRLG